MQFPLRTDANHAYKDSSLNQAAFEFSNLNIQGFASDGFGSALLTYPQTGSNSAATTASYFTLTLSSSTPFDPHFLRFKVAKGGSSDPRGYLIKSSSDGFTSNVAVETLPSGAPSAPQQREVSLGIVGVTSIVLRVYIWAPSSMNSIDWWDMEVYGHASL